MRERVERGRIRSNQTQEEREKYFSVGGGHRVVEGLWTRETQDSPFFVLLPQSFCVTNDELTSITSTVFSVGRLSPSPYHITNAVITFSSLGHSEAVYVCVDWP